MMQLFSYVLIEQAHATTIINSSHVEVTGREGGWENMSSGIKKLKCRALFALYCRL